MNGVDFNIKILVVDDQKTMARIIRNLLGQLNFKNVETASDGEQALPMLREGNFGLVISDWNMEIMSGLTLLKKVREDKKISDIPFIMVTAESKTDNVIAAKKAGVNNYIVKPFSAATLKTKLNTVIGPF